MISSHRFLHCEGLVRHLWTTVTTEDTVTHDAGAPEWLDLPLKDFVVNATPDIEELPLSQELDPPWLLQSRWLIDEIDVGRPLLPIVEFRDPLGITLYNDVPTLDTSEEAFTPQEFTTVPMMLDLRWRHVWYTVPGVYTFIVRWAGSPATRETGQFCIIMTESDNGGSDG